MPGQERMQVRVHLISHKKRSLVEYPFHNTDQVKITVSTVRFLCHI